MDGDLRVSHLRFRALSSAKHRSPVAYLAAFLRDDEKLRNDVSDLWYLLPGSRDVTVRLASYLLDLPSANLTGPTALEVCIRSALTRIHDLGLHPYSVRAHVNGLSVLLSSILDQVSQLQTISASCSDGTCWEILQGPLSLCLEAAPDREVSTVSFDFPVCRNRAKMIRHVLLSHLISRSELVRLSPTWNTLVRPHP